MKYNFCTLFDSNYLYKGLALYQSLCDVNVEFHIYVVAFDDECYLTLKKLNLDKLTVISLSEFETEELLAVKNSRNRAEYCWTSGPSVIYHFMMQYQLSSCTYLDADLMFYSSPKPIFDEIGKDSVAITEHFTEVVDELAGRFCVQFVYFKNDASGMEALIWWKDECINWCYSRFEDGKYGDQKYLDYFPEKFSNVCILKNRGAGVAQWNVFQYDFSKFGKILYKGDFLDIIFFHYHGTKIDLINDILILKTITYDLEPNVEKNIYIPYLELLKTIYNFYFGFNIKKVSIEKRSLFKQFSSKLKKIFRHNKIVQFLYYKVFRYKYNGYESN